MKIVFRGTIEKRRRGCPVCGRRSISNTYSAMKTYILPSGITKTFRAGKVEEVNDRDGEFLLMYKYTDTDGKVRNVFEEVKDGNMVDN